MKRIAILAAALFGAALFFGCSNSSDTPIIPSSGSSGPSVTIVGPNEMAADSVTTEHAVKQIRLFACATGWADDAQVKYEWRFINNGQESEENEHLDHGTNTDQNFAFNSKSGDTSVTDSTPQTVTVQVLVYKYDADSSKLEQNKKAGVKATYTVTIKASQPELKFLRWAPASDFQTPVAGLPQVFKKADSIKPGDSVPVADAIPSPVFNGYCLNPNSNSVNYNFTISDGDVANFIAPGKTDATHAKGLGNTDAKCVNKTDKTSVTVTVSGTLVLSDTVKQDFSKSVAYKVEKGKKVKLNLVYTPASGTMTEPKYGDAAVDTTIGTGSDKGVVLTDLYAGVEYTTKAITCKIDDAAKKAGDLSATKGGTILDSSEGGYSVTDGVFKLTVPYATTDAEKTFFVNWTNQ